MASIISCCHIETTGSVSVNGNSYSSIFLVKTDSALISPQALVGGLQSQSSPCIPYFSASFPGIENGNGYGTFVGTGGGDPSVRLATIAVSQPLQRSGGYHWKLTLNYEARQQPESGDKSECDVSQWCPKISYNTVTREVQKASMFYEGWWEDRSFDTCVRIECNDDNQDNCPRFRVRHPDAELIATDVDIDDPFPLQSVWVKTDAGDTVFRKRRNRCSPATNSIAEPYVENPIIVEEHDDQFDITLYYPIGSVNFDYVSCLKKTVNSNPVILFYPCIASTPIAYFAPFTARIGEIALNNQTISCTRNDASTGNIPLNFNISFWEVNVSILRRRCGWCEDRPNLSNHRLTYIGAPNGFGGFIGDADIIQLGNALVTPIKDPINGTIIETPRMIHPFNGQPLPPDQSERTFYNRYCPYTNIPWTFL